MKYYHIWGWKSKRGFLWYTVRMYYCMQVSPYEEERVIEWVKVRVDAALYSEIFHLTRTMRRKFKGNWNDYVQKLLPGYVFVETAEIEEFHQALRRIPLMTKLLGRGGEAYSPLNASEETWLSQLKGANGEVAVSFIRIMEDGEVKILSGPLIGLAGQIERINLHKRYAAVAVELMGVRTTVHMGIEIVKPAESEGF